MTKRIALLVCDTPVPDVVAEDGKYPQIFHTLMKNALPSNLDAESTFTMDAFDVMHEMEYPSEDTIEEYDVVMLTGSSASAYADIEWINKLVAFISQLAKNHPKIKIFGICFGHQIVARALGGECVKNDGKWEIGPTPLTLTNLGKEVFGVEDLNIEQMHQDHVPYVPPGFHLLGSTSVSYNQGMVAFTGSSYASTPTPIHSEPETTPHVVDDLTKIRIITVQGHPEFNKGIVDKIVKNRTGRGIFTAEMQRDADRKSEWRNDGLLIGRVFWQILGVA